tara:strand:- start:1975 stop:2337 length:363 start_codon:yes stop_codon:yes gene_type:complete
MATLTPTLTLNTSDATSSPISLTFTDILTTADPVRGLSRQTITTADNQEIVDNGLDAMMYVYVKNLDGTNYVSLQTTAGVVWGRLNPGEFCFFCIQPDAGLEVRANTASCKIEFAYWTKG